MKENADWLDQELRALAEGLTFPPTPPLTVAVRRRLLAEGAGPPARRPWALPAAGRALAGIPAALFLAAALGVLALALALGLSAPAREAVADFFDRLRIFQTEESPAGLPREITGTPVSLAEAEARLGFPVRLPTYPEGIESSLSKVLLQEFGESDLKAVVLLFDRPSGLRFALFQTNAGVGKGLARGAEAEPVAGLPGEAFWLEGLRIVQFYDQKGNVIQQSLRQTDANTLIWNSGGFVFRLEGDLSRDEAVRIAQSLR